MLLWEMCNEEDIEENFVLIREIEIIGSKNGGEGNPANLSLKQHFYNKNNKNN